MGFPLTSSGGRKLCLFAHTGVRGLNDLHNLHDHYGEERQGERGSLQLDEY